MEGLSCRGYQKYYLVSGKAIENVSAEEKYLDENGEQLK